MSEFTFNTWRDPYDACFSTCSKKEITLKEGLTVLVGCNGAGKSTLLANLQQILKQQHIPFYNYNNLHDGDQHSLGYTFARGDYDMTALMMCSSEGENICINLNMIGKNLKEFILTGDTPQSKEDKKWSRIFASKPILDEPLTSTKRFLLMDAVDSGLSVDNVVMLKETIELAVKDAKDSGIELYTIIAANEYELARGVDCFDVAKGEYIIFKDYEDYRAFILKSRKNKNKRDQSAFEKQDKKRQRQLEQVTKLAIRTIQTVKPFYKGDDVKRRWISNVKDTSDIKGWNFSRDEIEKLIDKLVAESADKVVATQ